MATDDVSRKASAATGAEYNLVDPASIAKFLSKKDVSTGKVRLKKPPSKPKVKDSESKPSTRSPTPDSPLINEVDPELRSTFPTGRPMEDTINMIQCKHCKKPMLKSVATSHIKLCLQKKQDRLQKRKENKEAARKAREARDKAEAAAAASAAVAKDDEDSTAAGYEDGKGPGGQTDGVNGGVDEVKPKTAKKAAAKATTAAVDGKATGKKRKAGEGAEGEKEPKKKKTKKELEAAKAKVPKPKQPVDVEKQCGVPLPNGLLCARSLTCKSHSMGAKRQVPGRSLPYAVLLSQYQKRNQAKQQKAAMDANAPLPDEVDPSGPVDSDEEKDLVMAAIAHSCPRPLEQHIHIPLKKRYAYIRVKEMLGQALGGKSVFVGGGGSGGGMQGQNTTAGVGLGGAMAGGPGLGGAAAGGDAMGGVGGGIGAGVGGGGGEVDRRGSVMSVGGAGGGAAGGKGLGGAGGGAAAAAGGSTVRKGSITAG